jgi:hypothetical protein
MKEYGMSLSDRLKNASVNSKNTVCKIGRLLDTEQLSQKDREHLVAVLDASENDPNRVNNASLARVLREEGFDISDSSVDRHRRKDCACYRRTTN